MLVKEVIEKLKEYNPEAEMTVIAHNKDFKFTFAFGGGGEGVEKDNAETVSLYVDELCSNETCNCE